MSSEYSVIFSGEIIDNLDENLVKSNLATKLDLSEKKAEGLFTGEVITIKKFDKQEDAEKLVSIFKNCGAICNISTTAISDSETSDNQTSASEKNCEGTKTCPFCHEEVKAAAIKCKHCSSDISTVDESYLPDEKQTELSECESKITAKCHSCGYSGQMCVVDTYHSDTAKYTMIFVVVCLVIYALLFYAAGFWVQTFVMAFLYAVWIITKHAHATCPKCSSENHLQAGVQGFQL